MTASNETRRRCRPIFRILLIVILVFMLGPILMALGAALFADSFGCGLDEGSVHSCVVAGLDWGDMLYTMGMMHWLALITLPLGSAALLVWLLALVITFFIRHRAASRNGA